MEVIFRTNSFLKCFKFKWEKIPNYGFGTDYLNAMQNPQTAQAFSTIMAQTDMSSFNPSQGIGATNMNDLMGTLLSKGSTFDIGPAQIVNMAQTNPAFRNQAANIVRSANPQLAQQLQQGAGGDSQQMQLMIQEMNRVMQEEQLKTTLSTAYLSDIYDVTGEFDMIFEDRFKDIAEQIGEVEEKLQDLN